ncbi:MAG: hypothetical protein ABIA66_03940, partial [Candidatus Omnitrophota bacterium]
MTALFLKKEIFPCLFSKQAKGYRKIIPADLLLKDSWYGIYFKNAKIGYSHTQVTAAGKIEDVSYTITTQAFLNLSILGESQLVWLEGEANLKENHLLKDFIFLLRMGDQKFSVEGRCKSADKLLLKINTASGSLEQELTVPPDLMVASLFSPFNMLANLKQREQFIINFFNPVTQGIESARVRVLRREKLLASGVLSEALVIESDSQGFKTITWVDADKGDILRQETPLGWTVIKEPQLEAVNFVRHKTWEKRDLASALSIRTNLTLPAGVKYLKLSIRNLDPGFSIIRDERQRFLKRSPEETVLEINSFPLATEQT